MTNSPNILDAGAHARSHLVVLADHESHAWCYDVRAGQLVSRFNVIHDIGGRRITVSGHWGEVVTAAYTRYGVASYRCSDGKLLWHRKDIKKTQYACYDEVRECWVVTKDPSGAVLINRDGTTKAIARRAIRWCADSSARVLLTTERRKIVLSSDTVEKRKVAATESFSVLDVCLHKNRAFVSEPRGPLRCFDTDTGAVVWRMDTSKEHYLYLSYSEEANMLRGVKWEFTNASHQALDTICPVSGKVLSSIELSRSGLAGTLCDHGRYYVGNDLIVTDATSGIQSRLPMQVD